MWRGPLVVWDSPGALHREHMATGLDQYSNHLAVISGLSCPVLKEQARNWNLYGLLISIDVSGSGNNCGEEKKERKKLKDRRGQQRRR